MSELPIGILGDGERRETSIRLATLSSRAVCERCQGTGNEFYFMYRKCSDCGGVGVVAALNVEEDS